MAQADENLDLWRALSEKLVVQGDDRTSCPRPTAEELDRFEAKSGIKLPAGYRGFVQVFGPGSFNRTTSYEVSVCSPYPPRRTKPKRFRFAPGSDIFHNLKTGYGLTDQARRLVYFASDYSGGSFGWDPEEATDPLAPEFAIYALYRDQKTAAKMSNTFAGFVKLCLDSKAITEHQKKGIYYEDAAESDFSFLDGLSKKKVYDRARQ